jgi:N6-L-threonylcarbamoyladenine synthase
MLYLGIESSCDETAAAVVEEKGGRLYARSNIVASQIETHRLYGGVVPEIASRAHTEAISRVVKDALAAAGVSPCELDAVGVTAHPGLIGALLVGVNFAKGFAAAYDLPLVPVDHIRAHIAAAYVTGDAGEMPAPPFLALAVSGGHTSLYAVGEGMTYTPVCATRDDAIGESFDKIGRMIGIPYPAGAGFDRLAAEGFLRATGESDVRVAYRKFAKSEAYRSGEYNLPSPALEDGTADFSFSGLKTAAINLLHRYEQKALPLDRARFAARYTYEVCEAVAKKITLAIEQNPDLTALVVAGGVAANSHLRARLAEVAKKKGIPLHIPSLTFCGDNAAMIGAQGYYEYQNGTVADSTLNASAMDSI